MKLNIQRLLCDITRKAEEENFMKKLLVIFLAFIIITYPCSAEGKEYCITKCSLSPILYGNHLLVEYYTGNGDEREIALIDKDGRIEYSERVPNFNDYSDSNGLWMFTDNSYTICDNNKLTWYDYDDNIIAEQVCDGIVREMNSKRYYGIDHILCYKRTASIDHNLVTYNVFNDLGEMTGSIEIDDSDRSNKSIPIAGCTHTGNGNLFCTQYSSGDKLKESYYLFSKVPNTDPYLGSVSSNYGTETTFDGGEHATAVCTSGGNIYYLLYWDKVNSIKGIVDEISSYAQIVDMNDDSILVYFKNSVSQDFWEETDHSGYYLYTINRDDVKKSKCTRYEGEYFKYTLEKVLKNSDYSDYDVIQGHFLDEDDLVITVIGIDGMLHFIHLDRNLQDKGTPVLASELNNGYYSDCCYGKELFAMNSHHHGEEDKCIVCDYYGNVIYDGEGEAVTLARGFEGNIVVLRTGISGQMEIVYFENNEMKVIDKIYMP